jgi:hypothetical protein
MKRSLSNHDEDFELDDGWSTSTLSELTRTRPSRYALQRAPILEDPSLDRPNVEMDLVETEDAADVVADRIVSLKTAIHYSVGNICQDEGMNMASNCDWDLASCNPSLK